MELFNIDWGTLLLPDVSVVEIFIRGTITYLSLYIILRLVLKRQAGTLGITDLLVVVLIADAAQNAMAGQYNSISSGLILVGTIIFWSYALDWLGYRIPALQKFVHPAPLALVKNGQIIRRNMRQELITEGELMSQLHQQGVSDLAEVKEAYMEGDGRISVITHENQQHQGNHERRGT